MSSCTHTALGRELMVKLDSSRHTATVDLVDQDPPRRLGVLELDRERSLWRSSLTNTLDGIQNHLEMFVRHHQRLAALKK